MKKLVLLFLVFSFSVVAKKHDLIPVEVLFRDPLSINPTLSPNGKYVLLHQRFRQLNVLSIIDPITDKFIDVLETSNLEDISFSQNGWVDNDTIYVNIGKKIGFIELSESDGEISTRWHSATSPGVVISTLPSQENTLLFAHNSKPTNELPELTLYKAKVDHLIQRDFDQSERLNNELEDAITYYFDDKNNIFHAAKLNEETLTFLYLNKNTKRWQKYWEINKETEFTPVGLYRENVLAVLTNKNLDHVSLVEFDLTTQSLGEVIFEHPMYDLISAELNKVNHGVNNVKYIEYGVPVTHYFSEKKQNVSKLLKRIFKNQSVSVVSSSLNENESVINVFDSDNPGEFYYFNHKKMKAIGIGTLKSHLDNYSLSKSQTFEVQIDDEQTVEAIITKPIGVDNGVLLVYPHGGPIGIRDYATFDNETQFFTNRGYTVLKVNFRGSSGFGKHFQNQGKGQFGQIIEQDITKVVDQVTAEHHFNHICSIGSSYGGYSAVMLAIKHPDTYQCVISMYGVYDLLHLFNATNYKTLAEYRQEISEVVGEFDESLKEVSPFYFADKLNVPILLIAGKKDNIADFEQANRMKYVLKKLDKTFETVFYENVGHGHHYWFGDQHQFLYIDDFIRRTLELDYPKSANSFFLEKEEQRTLKKGYDLLRVNQ